jgi:N-methylhydantoinase A
VATPLGLPVEVAAEGIIRICVANMAAELKAMTAEQGVNPRGFSILAGGGGGPLHAAALAAEFGIARVIVPAFPGLLSAGGLVLSDMRVDRLRSFRCRLERDGAEALAAAAAELAEEVVDALRREGYLGEPVVEVALDMKYTGQNWEIRVEVPGRIEAGEVQRRFDETHNGLYGFSLPEHTHEVLSIRATAVGPNDNALDSVPRRTPTAGATDRPASTSRRMWDDARSAFVDGQVYAWDDLGEGANVQGPAIIEGMDSTVWVPAAGRAVADAYGNVILDLGERT